MQCGFCQQQIVVLTRNQHFNSCPENKNKHVIIFEHFYLHLDIKKYDGTDVRTVHVLFQLIKNRPDFCHSIVAKTNIHHNIGNFIIKLPKLTKDQNSWEGFAYKQDGEWVMNYDALLIPRFFILLRKRHVTAVLEKPFFNGNWCRWLKSLFISIEEVKEQEKKTKEREKDISDETDSEEEGKDVKDMSYVEKEKEDSDETDSEEEGKEWKGENDSDTLLQKKKKR